MDTKLPVVSVHPVISKWIINIDLHQLTYLHHRRKCCNKTRVKHQCEMLPLAVNQLRSCSDGLRIIVTMNLASQRWSLMLQPQHLESAVTYPIMPLITSPRSSASGNKTPEVINKVYRPFPKVPPEANSLDVTNFGTFFSFPVVTRQIRRSLAHSDSSSKNFDLN